MCRTTFFFREMTFLCEYKVNDHEAWRRRRQMKNSAEFNNEVEQLNTEKFPKIKATYDFILNIPRQEKEDWLGNT